VPDVSTVEAFKRAMLAAQRVVYGNPAQVNASGELIMSILATAGILYAVASKVVRFTDIVPGNEMVARGEADIGLFNLEAIPYSVGVQLAGPVPAPLQLYTSYEGAVMAKAAAGEPALAFVRSMAGESARPVWAAAGFEAAPAPYGQPRHAAQRGCEPSSASTGLVGTAARGVGPSQRALFFQREH
jgi:molybdate transport system substrate-binding protein